jgi:hypothetical protein
MIDENRCEIASAGIGCMESHLRIARAGSDGVERRPVNVEKNSACTQKRYQLED